VYGNGVGPKAATRGENETDSAYRSKRLFLFKEGGKSEALKNSHAEVPEQHDSNQQGSQPKGENESNREEGFQGILSAKRIKKDRNVHHTIRPLC